MAEKKRLSRSRRSDHPPHMRLMKRDIEIIEAVALYRILRQDQIQQLFFGSRSTTQYRLSHLFQHGFIDRHFLPVYRGWSPTLYTVTKQGIALLKTEIGLSQIVRWDAENGHEFLTHALAINDFRVAVTLACRDADYGIVQWASEVDLKSDYDRVTIVNEKGKEQSVSLIPDSYFILQTPFGKAAFFLEMDMGTMTLARFQTKIRAYIAYMKSGEYQKRYQTKSLRVLTVTTSETRRINLSAAAQSIGGDRKFQFTSASQVNRMAVLQAPIWQASGSDALASLIPTAK